MDCNNYRGISLLCHSSKRYTSIILHRIRRRTDEILGEEQAGFRAGRSTIDQIFTLNVVTPGNKLHKYADDTYLIVPSTNSQSISLELAHIAGLAEENNLKFNTSKSLEMVVCRPLRGKTLVPTTFSTEIPNVARVTSLNILGVIIRQNLTMHE